LTIEKWRKEFEPYIKDIRQVDLADPYVLSDCSIIKIFFKGRPDFLFLEAGCGTARDSLILAREGARVVGLDITREALLSVATSSIYLSKKDILTLYFAVVLLSILKILREVSEN